MVKVGPLLTKLWHQQVGNPKWSQTGWPIWVLKQVQKTTFISLCTYTLTAFLSYLHTYREAYPYTDNELVQIWSQFKATCGGHRSAPFLSKLDHCEKLLTIKNPGFEILLSVPLKEINFRFKCYAFR